MSADEIRRQPVAGVGAAHPGSDPRCCRRALEHRVQGPGTQHPRRSLRAVGQPTRRDVPRSGRGGRRPAQMSDRRTKVDDRLVDESRRGVDHCAVRRRRRSDDAVQFTDRPVQLRDDQTVDVGREDLAKFEQGGLLGVAADRGLRLGTVGDVDGEDDEPLHRAVDDVRRVRDVGDLDPAVRGRDALLEDLRLTAEDAFHVAGDPCRGGAEHLADVLAVHLLRGLAEPVDDALVGVDVDQSPVPQSDGTWQQIEDSAERRDVYGSRRAPAPRIRQRPPNPRIGLSRGTIRGSA